MINLAWSAVRRWLAIIIAIILTSSCTKGPVEGPVEGPVDGGPKGAVAQNRAAGSAMYGLTAQVSFSEDPGGLAGTAMVYVFLREPGSRMPLAVQQFSAGELPKSVSFAGEQTGSLELVARLSPSGRVDLGPDDIEVIRTIPGLSHPPQNYAMVLDGTSGAAIDATPAQSNAESSFAASISIPILVDIEPGHSFARDTVVFVVARDPGKPMPTAVKRLSVADLPAQIELSDENAMMVSNRISDAEQLSLFARISTTGTVARSDADWVSEAIQVTPADGFSDRLILEIRPPGTR